MKARLYTLILMWTLVVGLLFSQVGAGFFHNKHDAHKNTHVLAAGEFAIQEHGEHCKLCAIDLIQLYVEPVEDCHIQEPASSIFVVTIHGTPSTSTNFLRGRSPPFLV